MVENHSKNRPNDEKHRSTSRTMSIMIAVSLGRSVASKHRNFFLFTAYAIDVSQYLLSTLLQYYTWPILSSILSYTGLEYRLYEKQ